MFPGGIGFMEMVVLAIVAVLLFGSRLPQVARNVGRGYGELRRGLSELKSTVNAEIDEAERSTPRRSRALRAESVEPVYDDHDEPTAPRLVPPPAGEST
jgi:sec-independent protein translocase protein TatA